MAHQGVTLILVPYHTGIANARVGAGPKRLLSNGLVERIQATGRSLRIQAIEPVDEFEGEIGRSFELLRRVATAVKEATESGSFPIVLAGNCNTTNGVAAGLSSAGKDDFDVAWFDAHADFDTPDEALSGYFDGMGVSMLIGESWKALMATIPGFEPIPLSRITLCGVRDVSEAQRAKLDRRRCKVVYGKTDTAVDYAEQLRGQSQTGNDDVGGACLVHLDLDVLDTSVGYANDYAAPGGLSKDQLMQCLDVITSVRRPVALTVASFDPACQGSESIADVGVQAISHLLQRLET